MTNQTNTHQGTNVEHLFANSILDHPNALSRILIAAAIPQNSRMGEPSIVGVHKRKTDVEIPILSVDQVLRVNIKSFGSTGYNQVERRKMPDFCHRNQIKRADEQFLTGLWLRKAKEQDGKGLLVRESEHERVQEIFRTISPGVSAFIGNDHPQILGIYSITESKWNLYDMQKQVLPRCQSRTLSFSKRGGNIEIGDYIVIQRKGSRRGESGADPYSIEHGSNHVQIKLKSKKFFNEVDPVATYTV